MAQVETSEREINSRLHLDGWVLEGGAKHSKWSHPSRPGIKIMVPRRKTLSPGVARSIAKAAGWI